jgi:hypothetical protein
MRTCLYTKRLYFYEFLLNLDGYKIRNSVRNPQPVSIPQGMGNSSEIDAIQKDIIHRLHRWRG